MNIDQIIDDIIKTEGGYVNDPNDSGGETMYGITVGVARKNGYTGAMKDLPVSLARTIYRDKYVASPGFEKVLAISAPIAAELVDTGVNMGPTIAGGFLQRSLNVLVGAGLVEDGKVGPATIKALTTFLNKRGHDGETVLLRALNSLQCARYIDLTRANVKNATFIYGWILNRVVI